MPIHGSRRHCRAQDSESKSKESRQEPGALVGARVLVTMTLMRTVAAYPSRGDPARITVRVVTRATSDKFAGPFFAFANEPVPS